MFISFQMRLGQLKYHPPKEHGGQLPTAGETATFFWSSGGDFRSENPKTSEDFRHDIDLKSRLSPTTMLS
jgi:hypothetical protein